MSYSFILFRHMLRSHVTCFAHELLGTKGDGGWKICQSGSLKLTKNNCIVYSIG